MWNIYLFYLLLSYFYGRSLRRNCENLREKKSLGKCSLNVTSNPSCQAKTKAQASMFFFLFHQAVNLPLVLMKTKE
jgi:hypothetical protein